jgi:hypothetical protein
VVKEVGKDSNIGVDVCTTKIQMEGFRFGSLDAFVRRVFGEITMIILESISYFISGAFIANSIPHIVNGISGKKFPEKSPFKNNSQDNSAFEVFFFSPIVNVVWGVLNLSIGFVLPNIMGSFRIGLNIDTLIFMVGFTSLAIFLAWNIGKVHYKR